MDHAAADEPPRTFSPTVRTRKYVPRNSEVRFFTVWFTCRGAPSAFMNSSGCTIAKQRDANAAPVSSYDRYAKLHPNPGRALDTSIPKATAGLKTPPEID